MLSFVCHFRLAFEDYTYTRMGLRIVILFQECNQL